MEGTSYVMAFAPGLGAWDRNKHTAAVYWVDADWQFPQPGVAAVGTRHVFTTSVVRCSDRAPIPGWQVHYEILDGPAAGFAPAGSRAMDVETTPQGQAIAEIVQSQPTGGANRIGIRITRPGTLPGTTNQPFVVATGSTLMTWRHAANYRALHGTGAGRRGSERALPNRRV